MASSPITQPTDTPNQTGTTLTDNMASVSLGGTQPVEPSQTSYATHGQPYLGNPRLPVPPPYEAFADEQTVLYEGVVKHFLGISLEGFIEIDYYNPVTKMYQYAVTLPESTVNKIIELYPQRAPAHGPLYPIISGEGYSLTDDLTKFFQEHAKLPHLVPGIRFTFSSMRQCATDARYWWLQNVQLDDVSLPQRWLQNEVVTPCLYKGKAKWPTPFNAGAVRTRFLPAASTSSHRDTNDIGPGALALLMQRDMPQKVPLKCGDVISCALLKMPTDGVMAWDYGFRVYHAEMVSGKQLSSWKQLAGPSQLDASALAEHADRRMKLLSLAHVTEENRTRSHQKTITPVQKLVEWSVGEDINAYCWAKFTVRRHMFATNVGAEVPAPVEQEDEAEAQLAHVKVGTELKLTLTLPHEQLMALAQTHGEPPRKHPRRSVFIEVHTTYPSADNTITIMALLSPKSRSAARYLLSNLWPYDITIHDQSRTFDRLHQGLLDMHNDSLGRSGYERAMPGKSLKSQVYNTLLTGVPLPETHQLDDSKTREIAEKLTTDWPDAVPGISSYRPSLEQASIAAKVFSDCQQLVLNDSPPGSGKSTTAVRLATAYNQKAMSLRSQASEGISTTAIACPLNTAANRNNDTNIAIMREAGLNMKQIMDYLASDTVPDGCPVSIDQLRSLFAIRVVAPSLENTRDDYMCQLDSPPTLDSNYLHHVARHPPAFCQDWCKARQDLADCEENCTELLKQLASCGELPTSSSLPAKTPTSPANPDPKDPVTVLVKPSLRTRLEKLLEKKEKLTKDLHKLALTTLRPGIIHVTIDNLSDSRLADVTVDFMIVDEISLVTPVQIAYIGHRVADHGKLLLVGDANQLTRFKPVTTAFDDLLTPACILRTHSALVNVTRLSEVYRCAPCLLIANSEAAYHGRLRSRKADDICNYLKIPRLDADVAAIPPSTFIVNTTEETALAGGGIFNRGEAATLVRVIRYLVKLAKNGLPQLQDISVLVVCMYNAQVEFVRQMLLEGEVLKNCPWAAKLHIMTADRAQSWEADVVLVSCVRSSGETKITPADTQAQRSAAMARLGFVRDGARGNVATTRARLLRVVVGNPYTLFHSFFWRVYITMEALMVSTCHVSTQNDDFPWGEPWQDYRDHVGSALRDHGTKLQALKDTYNLNDNAPPAGTNLPIPTATIAVLSALSINAHTLGFFEPSQIFPHASKRTPLAATANTTAQPDVQLTKMHKFACSRCGSFEHRRKECSLPPKQRENQPPQQNKRSRQQPNQDTHKKPRTFTNSAHH